MELRNCFLLALIGMSTEKSLLSNPSKNQNKELVTIKGNIIFANPPKSIPDGSVMTIRFNDASLGNGPARMYIQKTQIITGYKPGNFLSYQLKDIDLSKEKDRTDLPPLSMTSVSAVLNVAWKPQGDEWIREGDYLNTYIHYIELKVGKQFYDKDITLYQYK